MPDHRLEILAPARTSGLALSLCAASLCAAGIATALAPRPAAAASLDDHQEAVAALTEVKAAITELVQVDASFATDRNVYHDASQRAIILLAGKPGEGPGAHPGTSAGATGAIGHVDALLDRKDTPVWTASLRGVQATMRAAVAYLRESLKARELMDYQMAASRALTYLEVARGRPTEAGVLGGLEGSLANTVLGVPAGATQVDACQPPSKAPAYGTHNGYLAWLTVPGGDGSHTLAEAPGGTELVVQNGSIVLHTAADLLVAESCDGRAEATAQPPAALSPSKAAGAGPEDAPRPRAAEVAPRPQNDAAVQAQSDATNHSEATSHSPAGQASQPHAEASSQPPGGQTSQPHAEAASQPHAEASSQPPAGQTSQPHAEASSQPPGGQASQPHAEAASQPPGGQASQPQAEAVPPAHAAAARAQADQAAAPIPAGLYTKAQALEGAQLFAGKCVKCHGANLQGSAGPSVAGDDFLRTAANNGWTLAMVRYLVVNNMPLNSPDSLSPKQYASVMAFLLASNCFPAGSTPFPTAADPTFNNIKLGPVPGDHPGENERGVCKVE